MYTVTVGQWTYKNIIPAITTNMVTVGGSLPNLYDGADEIVDGNHQWISDGRPLNRSGWRPRIKNIDGYGTVITGSDGGGNFGCHLTFDFGEPVSASLIRPRASITNLPLGMWKVQGSQDGSTWNDLTQPFDLNLAFNSRHYYTIHGIPAVSQGGMAIFSGDGADLTANAYGMWRTGQFYPQLSDPNVTVAIHASKYWRYYRLVGVSLSIPAAPWDNVGDSFFLFCCDFWCPERIATVSTNPPQSGMLGVDGSTAPADTTEPAYPLVDVDQSMSVGDFTSIYSFGNRNIVGLTTMTTNPPHWNSEPGNQLFDNDFNFGPYGSDSVGERFTFRLDASATLTGLRIWSNGEPTMNRGEWKVQGSDDGSNWTDLSKAKSINAVFNASAFLGSKWYADINFNLIAPFRYYSLLCTQSGSGASRVANEMFIRTDTSPLCGGDRRGKIKVSNSNIARTEIGGSSNYSALVDGGFHPNNSLIDDPPYIITQRNDAENGQYFQFEFPSYVLLNRIVLSDDKSSGFGETNPPTQRGIWQIQGSDDLSNWTNIGSPVHFSPTYNTLMLVVPSNLTAYPYWRMTLTDVTKLAVVRWYEFTFDLVDTGQPAPLLAGAVFTDESVVSAKLTGGIGPPPLPFADESQFIINVGNFKIAQHLQVSFSDESRFNAYTSGGKSNVPQVILI